MGGWAGELERGRRDELATCWQGRAPRNSIIMCCCRSSVSRKPARLPAGRAWQNHGLHEGWHLLDPPAGRRRARLQAGIAAPVQAAWNEWFAGSRNQPSPSQACQSCLLPANFFFLHFSTVYLPDTIITFVWEIGTSCKFIILISLCPPSLVFLPYLPPHLWKAYLPVTCHLPFILIFKSFTFGFLTGNHVMFNLLYLIYFTSIVVSVSISSKNFNCFSFALVFKIMSEVK